MTSVKFDTTEVQRLSFDLSKAPAGVSAKASEAIRKGARDIERDAKVLCPVATGHLRSSIGEDMLGPLEAVIGPTANYGAFVEYGVPHPWVITARRARFLRFVIDGETFFRRSVVHPPMAPHPYMRPAADMNEPRITDAMAQIGGSIL